LSQFANFVQTVFKRERCEIGKQRIVGTRNRGVIGTSVSASWQTVQKLGVSRQ
jgi:hypothetical protein